MESRPLRNFSEIANTMRQQVASPDFAPPKPRGYGNCIPDCPVCGEIGWVGSGREVDDPKFGKIDMCPNKPKMLLPPDVFGLTARDMSLSWTNMLDSNNALSISQTVRGMLSAGSGWLFIWGEPGVGKTHLLKTAVAQTAQVKSCAYTLMADLVQNIRDGFNSSNDHESTRRFEKWLNIPVLAIDEVDRVKVTDWVAEKKAQLFDTRYRAAIDGRGVTLIASNSDPASMEKYFASRAHDGRFRVIHMTGADMRPAMG